MNASLFQISLTNKSDLFPTKVNGEAVIGTHLLTHGDVFTIIDRSFRYESTSESKKNTEAVSTEKYTSYQLTMLL